jgi:hypothetical protein
MQLRKQVIIDIAAVKDVKAPGVYELARLGPFRSIPGGEPHSHRYLP